MSVSDASAALILASQYAGLHKQTPSARQVRAMQAVARLENYYGQAKPFGGSFNWGCIQLCKPGGKGCPPEGCPENGFLHEDSYPKPDGTSVKYSVCFRKYANDDEGARALIAQLTTARPQTWAALDSGDAWAIAEAMYRERYYQGFGATEAQRISGYAKALSEADKAVSASTGTPRLIAWSGSAGPLATSPSSSDSGGGGWLLFFLAGGLALSLRK